MRFILFFVLLKSALNCRERICRRTVLSVSDCSPWWRGITACLGIKNSVLLDTILASEWYEKTTELCSEKCGKGERSRFCAICWLESMKERDEIDLLLEEVEKTQEEVADCFFSVFPRVEKQKTIQVQEKFLLQTYEFRLPSSMDQFAVEFPCLPMAFSFRNALCIPEQNFDQAAYGVNLERTNATENVELDLVLTKECSFDPKEVNLISLDGESFVNGARLQSLPNLFGTDLVDFVENRPKVMKVRVFVAYDQRRRRRSRDNGDYDYDYYDFNEDENDAFSPSFVFGIESKCDILISSAQRIRKQETNLRGLFEKEQVAIKSRRRRHLIGLSGSFNQFYRSVDSSNFEIELSVELLDQACRISSSAFFVDLDPPEDFLLTEAP